MSVTCPHMRADWRACPHCVQPVVPFAVADTVLVGSFTPCEWAGAGCVLAAGHMTDNGHPSVCVDSSGGMFQVYEGID